MKLFYRGKDGGMESTVTGYWLIEAKNLFSIALLKFEDGSRDAYHEHAFNSVSWLLKGKLMEHVRLPWEDYTTYVYTPHVNPIITERQRFHKVSSVGTSWVLTFRGPWNSTWREYIPSLDKLKTLTHGRKEL